MISTINKITYKYITCFLNLSTYIDYIIPVLNNSKTSKNCPCISPQTVTGLKTGWTLDSYNSIYLTF